MTAEARCRQRREWWSGIWAGGSLSLPPEEPNPALDLLCQLNLPLASPSPQAVVLWSAANCRRGLGLFPAAQGFFRIFIAQDGLSWHFCIVLACENVAKFLHV